MDQKRKFLCAALPLCLLMSLLPVPAHASGLPFADIDENDWYCGAVRYVYEQKLMDGTDGAAFSPDETTSRGMVVTVLHRMEGCPPSPDAGFSDVPPDRWYSGGANWAAASGVTGGYGDGSFGPEDSVTREQLAAILYRYCSYRGYDTGTAGDVSVFPDAGEISPYAVEAVAWAAASGILSGGEDGYLAPGRGASRAEVATVLARFHQTAFLPASSGQSEKEPELPARPAQEEPVSRPASNFSPAEPGLPVQTPPELPPELPPETLPELPPETPREGLRILRGGETVTGGEVRPGDTLSASAGSGAGSGIRWTVSGRSVAGDTYTVSSLDLGETITAAATGKEGTVSSAFVTVSRQTAFRPVGENGGPVVFAPETVYYAAYPDRPVTPGENAGMLLTAAPAQAEPARLEEAGAQLGEALSGTPQDIHAVDLSLLLTGEGEPAPVYPVGKTVVTLNRAALGLPESADLSRYLFAASCTGIDGENTCVCGETVSVDGGSYVRFVLNGLGRVYTGALPLYTVRFDPAGGSPAPAPQTVRSGGRIEAAAPPVREGWLFAGWTPEEETVAGDMTVTARWVQCVSAPGTALSGSWIENGEPAAAPANVKESASDGAVTLTLDSGATCLAGLRYRLKLAPPEGAVKYASAGTAEEAAASTQYVSLESGNPRLDVNVTDSGGKILPGGALYVKWLDVSGEILMLQSARLEIRRESGSSAEPAVPSQTKNIPVDRGLGRVSVRLIDESLPDYAGDITAHLDAPGGKLALTASFRESFPYPADSSTKISVGDYGALELRITPFAGAPALREPSEVTVKDMFGDAMKLPVKTSLKEDGIVLLWEPEAPAWPDMACLSVKLDGRTQDIQLVFGDNPPAAPALDWKSTSGWSEALTLLGRGEDVNYTGSAAAVIAGSLNLKQGQALDTGNVPLTIASGGSLTVSGSEPCRILANGVTVEHGGSLFISGGMLEIEGRPELKSGGTLETGGTGKTYPGEDHGGVLLAGDITIEDGHLSIYDNLTVAATGSVACHDEYGSMIFIGGSLVNEGTLSLAGDVTVSGDFENRSTLSISGGGFGGSLTLSGTQAPLRNAGTVTVGGECTLTLLGAALVNSGRISGTGSLLCGTQTVILEYDDGIERAEPDGSLPVSPGNCLHSRFVRDPADHAGIRIYTGSLSNEDGGTCRLTDGGTGAP